MLALADSRFYSKRYQWRYLNWRRLLRVPSTARRSNQSILKEIYSEYSLEALMLNAEAKAPILWPPDAKNWLIGKDPDAGKDWRQEEKGMTEDEMVGWHHWLDGHEFEQVPGVGDGQGSLVCCSPWGCKETDPTEHLNWIVALPLIKWGNLGCCLNFVPQFFHLQSGDIMVPTS